MSTIARPFRCLLPALTLTGGAGCGNPSIELTADKTQLCAGGIDHTTSRPS